MRRFVHLRNFASYLWRSPLVEQLWRISWPLFPIGAAASFLVSPDISIDSAVMATQTLNDFVIPHWPPLYPLFIRTINCLTGSVLWLLGGTAPGFVEPTFSAIALNFILLIQHGLAIVAAAYVALQFRLRLLGSRCVAAVLYLNPFTLSCIHNLRAEAPMAIFLLLALGSAVPILLYRDWALNRVIWFFVWIALAELSRHATVAFAFLLPAGLAWQAIDEWLSRRPGLARTTAKRMTIALMGVACAQVTVLLVADGIMVWRHVKPHSSLGRAFVYRLAEGSLSTPFLTREQQGGVFMTRAEHDELIRRLKASTADEVLLHTIDIVATTPDYSWVPAFNRVQDEVAVCARTGSAVSFREQFYGRLAQGAMIGAGEVLGARRYADDEGNESRCRWAETDRRLNQVAWLALRSFDPVLMRDAALRTGEVLAPFFVMPPFYPDSAWLNWKQLGKTWTFPAPSREGFDGPAMVKHFRWHLNTDFGIIINLAKQLRGIMVLVAIGLLAILLPFSRKAIPLCLGLLSAVIAYAAMISLVTVYIPRYGLPVDLFALFAILVAIISIYDTRWRTSPVKQSEDVK
jgi:hypothetical protein